MQIFSRFRKKKHGKKEEKQREERGKVEKRLSTMAEEEEDEGITIKVTDTSLHIWNTLKHTHKQQWNSVSKCAHQ